MNARAYNFAVTQTTDAVRTTTASGKAQIKFTGELTLRGETRSRTVVAQGKSAELIENMIGKGNEMNLRVLFERAPANDDGARGGEFLSVVGLPRAKKEAAAAA